MKKVTIVLGVLGLLILGIILFKDMIIKKTLPGVLSSALGAPVSLGDFSLSLLGSHLLIKDLRIDSPAGFSEGPVVDLARLEVTYDLMSLITGNNHFKVIDIDVRQAVFARNKEGKFNAQELKLVKQMIENPPPNKGPVKLSIDTLKLNLDTITVKDATGKRQVSDIHLRNRTYQDIRSVNDLMVKVVTAEAGLLAVTNSVFFAGRELKKGVGLLLNTTEQVVGSTAGGLLKKITQPLLSN